MSYPLTSYPVTWYKLKFYLRDTDEEMTEVKFLADLFVPDDTVPTRINHVPLLKGAAIQHNKPRRNLREIRVTGILKSRKDYNNLMQYYHVNVPQSQAPFPTEYIKQRYDFAILEEPSGKNYLVSFGQTLTITHQRAQKGEIVFPFEFMLYHVDPNETL